MSNYPLSTQAIRQTFFAKIADSDVLFVKKGYAIKIDGHFVVNCTHDVHGTTFFSADGWSTTTRYEEALLGVQVFGYLPKEQVEALVTVGC